MSDLTAEEYEAVTDAWVERLRRAMGTAGCNDVMRDEFPESVCKRFRFDMDVLEAWARYRADHEAPSPDPAGRKEDRA